MELNAAEWLLSAISVRLDIAVEHRCRLTVCVDDGPQF